MFKQKLLTLFVALICAVQLFAYDAYIDGIYYNLNTIDKTAAVTNETGDYHAQSYSGVVAIPPTITYDSQTYSVTTIGYQAFSGCSGLTSVTIPNSVTTIGYEAFSGCSGLTSVTIGNSVTTIGNYAFDNCRGLTSVTIGNSVTSIGDYAFYYCHNLTSINVDAANTHYTSLDGVLFNYAKDTLIQYPFGSTRKAYTIPSSVTTIGDLAFYGCSGLTSVTIPNSVTTIGGSAFEDCSGLTSVTIPASVTTIGDWAFGWCTGLTSVTIPNSVTSIGNNTFNHVNNIVYSGTATWEDDNLYWGAKCVNGYVDGYFVYSDASKTTLCGCSSVATGEIVIPSSVTTIGDYAFYDCDGLTSITIPSSVTTIGGSAFDDCDGLTSVTIPNSVTTIGKYAFFDCSGLTSVTIPSSVTTIGDGAFDYCGGLKKTNYTGTIADWCKIKFGSNPIVYSNNFFINDVEIKDLVIPEGVDTINDDAFYDCSGLTSVTIPNSVTTIGDYAFYYCDGLTSVTIGNSVTTIGERAFCGCSGLTSVTIPNSVTTIGSYAFYNVNNIVYSGTATWEDDDLYWWGAKHMNCFADGYFVYSDASKTTLCGCSSVATGEIVIPSSVTTIGNRAFYGCSGLTSVEIPNSVTTIGDGAFDGCSSLTSVTIPNSVTTIGYDAFWGCSGLTSVTIGNSVTTIGESAFDGCKGLTSITCYAVNPPTCDGVCFYNVDKSIPLYVPAESVEAYRKAEGWQDFTNILPITAEEVEVTEPETEPTNNSVVISWPSVADGETYTIEIRKGEELICTLVFNANGQLMSINFAAPARGGEHSSRYATATATGWTYTITGLEVGTEYTYTIVAKDNGGKTLYSEIGSFKTTEIITSVENVDSQKSQVESHKFIRNGVLYIERNGKTYNVSGQKVK